MTKRFYLIILIILFMTGCAEDPIIGQWERFGDDAEGTIVQVEPVGESYHAKLIKVSGILEDLNFIENEIKWRDIKPTSRNKWRGKDLIKALDNDGNITVVEYKDVHFTLTEDGILEIHKFAKEQEVIGTEQKWRRIE